MGWETADIYDQRSAGDQKLAQALIVQTGWQ
jgi:hypothetical protein